MRKAAEDFLLCVLGTQMLMFAGCRERTPAGDEAEPALPTPAITAAKATSPVRIIYPAAPGSFVDLTKEMAPSVVHLRSSHRVKRGPAQLLPGSGDSYALGSGFILDVQGHIVTSEHVIATAPEVQVVFHDGFQVPAQVIGRDSRLDVALLKVDVPPRRLKPMRLGSSEDLRVGEWVLALGNPEGSEVTASAGLISAKGASERDTVRSKTNYRSFLQTDAKIDGGNSGGPLVDTSGAVVGINSAIANEAGSRRLAVPITHAEEIFPMLKESGIVTRAWLGVFVHPVTPEIAKRLKLESIGGALVSSVLPSSPAAKAGIKEGDVILEFNSKAIDHRSLPWLAASSGIDRQIPIVVWRSGQSRKLNLITEKMPD